MTDIGPINSKSNNCFILNHNASACLFCSKKEMSQLETRTLNRFFFFSVLANPLKFEDKPENPVQQSEVLCEGYNVKYCVTEMLISLLLVIYCFSWYWAGLPVTACMLNVQLKARFLWFNLWYIWFHTVLLDLLPVPLLCSCCFYNDVIMMTLCFFVWQTTLQTDEVKNVPCGTRLVCCLFK